VPDTREAVARALHEAYVRQRLAAGEPLGATGALTTWDELPEEFRLSSRRNADDLEEALRERGFEVTATAGPPGVNLDAEDVECVAERLHERWMEERLATGWREGAPRDDSRRIHPDLVPWPELPDARRDIDRALLRVFPEALQAVGLRLVRDGADREGPAIDGMHRE
jgi:hypothetical protein